MPSTRITGLGNTRRVSFATGMVREIVKGHIYGLTLQQFVDLFDQEGVVQRIGMIEIEMSTLASRKMGCIFVVGIVGQIGDPIPAHTFEYLVHNRGLA